MTTICPNKEKYVPVSATLSPVTQVALVEVNSALKNGRDDPSLLEIGNINNNAPVKMTTIKPSGKTLIGFIPIFGLCIRLFVSPRAGAVSPAVTLRNLLSRENVQSLACPRFNHCSGRKTQVPDALSAFLYILVEIALIYAHNFAHIPPPLADYNTIFK